MIISKSWLCLVGDAVTIAILASATGGAGGIRTPYLLTASQTLSQLSYSPPAYSDII